MPTSPVPCANMIPDLIVVRGYIFDAVYAPLAIELTDSAVNAQPVEPSHYHYKEVGMTVEQMLDLTFTLRDIQSGLVKCLAASMSALAFDYGREILPVKWSVESSPTGLSMQNVVAEDSDREVVKKGFKMTL